MVYYDHEKNSGPLMGSVLARVAIAAKREGRTYRVEFTGTTNGIRYYYEGGRHGLLSLAKSLKANNAKDVVLTGPKGQVIDIDAERF